MRRFTALVPLLLMLALVAGSSRDGYKRGYRSDAGYSGAGYSVGASMGGSSSSIQYIMAQNGDDPQVVVTLNLETAKSVTASSLESISSVDWLADQTHADSETSASSESHVLTFAASDVTLWDTDTLRCIVTYSDASLDTLTRVINYTPPAVTVVHDGYIAGGFAQSYISMLIAAATSPDSNYVGALDSWEDFADNYDYYQMPKHIISELSDGHNAGTNLLVDDILPHNPDFIPVAFIDFGFRSGSATDPNGSISRVALNKFSTAEYTMYYSDDHTTSGARGDTVTMNWGAKLHNPLGFVVADGDTTWWFEEYADMISGMISHSTNYVANLQLMFDWAEDGGVPWFEGTDRAFYDFDEDDIGYGTDEWFDPDGVRIWGDITPDQAYQIALRRFYTEMKSRKDLFMSYNGQFASERPTGDSADFADTRFMEEFRAHVQTGTYVSQSKKWLYTPNWESFIYAVTDFSDDLMDRTGLPWAPVHWDSRENIVDASGERTVVLEQAMSEGAALLGNGINGFAYLDRLSPGKRYAYALGDTLQTMDLGVPDGPVVVDSWGQAHRYWTKGSVWVEWMGDMRSPTPYAWTVLNTAGDTLRTRNHGRAPDLEDSDFIFYYYDPEDSATPDEYFQVQETESVFVASSNFGAAWIQESYPTSNNAESSHVAMSSDILDPDTTWWPVGDCRIGLFTLGLEEVLDGQRVTQANLIIEGGWENDPDGIPDNGDESDYAIDLAVGDTIFFLGITDPEMGVWRDDLTSTSYNEPSPGETWPKAPSEWMISDFGAVAHLAGPMQLAGGDTASIDITDLVVAASENSDTWGGIACVLRLQADPATIQNIHNFDAPAADSQRKIYITATTLPIDTTPPDTPENLVATAGNGTVGLEWDDNSESDLADYTVYRADDRTARAVLQAGVAVSNYTDNTAENGTEYDYQVSATDNDDNESTLHAVVSATPVDLAFTSFTITGSSEAE